VYFSSNNIRGFKLRRVRWTYRGKEKYEQGFGGKPEGKRLIGKQGVDGIIILRRIVRKWEVGTWTEFICLRTGTCGGAVVKVVMNLRVPQNLGNFLSG
jgi:hypothetical protein